MTTVQTLKDLGEQMGLKGTELKDFIREQQTLEREEREKQRDHEKIQEQREREREIEHEKQRIWQAEQQDKEREPLAAEPIRQTRQ